jgi:ATP-dependent protease Clp ATPase subunit
MKKEVTLTEVLLYEAGLKAGKQEWLKWLELVNIIYIANGAFKTLGSKISQKITELKKEIEK